MLRERSDAGQLDCAADSAAGERTIAPDAGRVVTGERRAIISVMDPRDREVEPLRRHQELHRRMQEIDPPATMPLHGKPPEPRPPRWKEYLATKAEMEAVERELEELRRRRAESSG